MKAVVQFGAGAIGRGFLGQLWSEAGYEVVFIDVNRELVDALNARCSYPLRLVDNKTSRDLTIAPIRALHVNDIDAVITALACCDFAATAVGIAQMEGLGARFVGPSLRRRSAAMVPLTIFICENGSSASERLYEGMRGVWPSSADLRSGSFHFIPTIVSRMVPPVSPEVRSEDPLLLVAEPYTALPYFDSFPDAYIPPVPALEPQGQSPEQDAVTRWQGLSSQKLYTHNGGHAVLAFHGLLRGHRFIWQAAEDEGLVSQLRGFWDETSRALCQLFRFRPVDQRRHEDDLLQRFRNRVLGDTCERVARDPCRKLGADERLVKAASFCLSQEIQPTFVCRAIAAALRHPQIAPIVETQGVKAALASLSGLSQCSPIVSLVEAAYNAH